MCVREMLEEVCVCVMLEQESVCVCGEAGVCVCVHDA